MTEQKENWSDAEWVKRHLRMMEYYDCAQEIAAAFSRQRKEIGEEVVGAMETGNPGLGGGKYYKMGKEDMKRFLLSAVRDVFNKLNGV